VDRSPIRKAVLLYAILISFSLAPPGATAAEAEVGPNDFRVSWMNPGGDPVLGAFHPAVAYNAANREFLAVWEGDTGNIGEFEIYGQRADALTSAVIGTSFRITHMGPDGDSRFQARTPAVVWNEKVNEYLVVWRGDTNTGGLVDNEFEIFGQRVNGATGALVGTAGFRVSIMGPDGDPSYAAIQPVVAWNSKDNRYLVAWYGDTDANGGVNGDLEIFGQMLDGTSGNKVGLNSIRLTYVGGTAANGHNASHPALAYNKTDNEFLLVLEGDNPAYAQEIWRERLAGFTGAPLSVVRVSRMGLTDSDARFNAFRPAVAWNSRYNQYLVLWHGSDDASGVAARENEIFGRLLSGPTGTPLGPQFRVSNMGPDGDIIYDAYHPAVAHNSATNAYLVCWEGTDKVAGLADNEIEVFSQQLDAAGAKIGNYARISAMGPSSNPAFRAQRPTVTQDTLMNRGMTVWQGSNNPLIVRQFDIFGQLLAELVNSVSRAGYTLGILQPGEVVYADHSDIFSPPVPSNLAGQLYIRTRNDDADLTSADFLTFRAEAPVTVYVALADDIATPPAWLSKWTKLTDTLSTTNGGRTIYSNNFPPGLVTLGANRDSAMPTGKDMYSVVITLRIGATDAAVWALYE